MVRLLRCLVLAQITPKLHHKEAKRRFIVSIAVFVLFEIEFGTSLLYTMLKTCATHTYKGLNDFNPPWSLLLARYMQRSRGKS